MIAHNCQSLDNRKTQQQAAEALTRNVISREEYDRIREAYPVTLYTPNVFIYIGLFLLTVVAVACGLGLFLLIIGGGGDRGIGVSLIVWGIAAYGGLEYFIRVRGFFQAGVDDALLYLAGVLIYAGVNFVTYHISPVADTGLVFVLALFGVLRYADRLMALVAYGALLGLLFHLTKSPFVFMVVSIIAYFLVTRLSTSAKTRHYHSCLTLLRAAALLSFYASGNYFIIRNINASIRGEDAHIALGWLWWGFTGVIPIAYIVAGVRKKDSILLWIGLGLVAAAVFTIRYYHHILPAEVAMILGGILLIAGAYGLIRYLHPPKHGFTSQAPDEPHPLKNLPVESLILAETFKTAPTQPAAPNNPFGGGSGGGAGAGGTY